MSCDCDDEIKVYPPGTDPICQERVAARPTAKGTQGTPYVQANISSIALTLYRIYDGVPYVVTGYDGLALTVASVIFNTLQDWDQDTLGYNFEHVIDADDLDATATYEAHYTFTLVGGKKFTVRKEFIVKGPVDAGSIPTVSTSVVTAYKASLISDVTVENTTTPTSGISSGSFATGSTLTIAANTWGAGVDVVIVAGGRYKTAAAETVHSPSIVVELLIGSEVTETFNLAMLPDQNDRVWDFEARLTRRSIGATGKVAGWCKLNADAAAPDESTNDIAEVTVPSDAGKAIDIRVTWSAANADLEWTTRYFHWQFAGVPA